MTRLPDFILMKQILVSACFYLFLFAGCKKSSTEPYFGYAKADINGVSVSFNKARGNILYNLNDTISLNFEKWDGLILKEEIGIQKIFKLTNNSQRIHKYSYNGWLIEKLSSSYGTLRDDGDVGCDMYDIYQPDSLQNHITITSFNPQTNEIRGTFQATYLIDPTRIKCRPTAPDTIRIRNGEFYTKIL